MPLSPDKVAARAMLRELERIAERRKAGLLDASVETAKAPLLELLELWIADLALTGCTDRHQADMRRLVTAVVAACGWRLPADLAPDRLDLYLATMDRASRTKATYRQAVNGLANWLVGKRKLPANPLECSTRPAGEARRKRRALTVEELRKLLAAALDRPLRDELLIRSGPRKGLLERRISDATRARAERKGRHNALLYRLAFYTGFRAGELGALRAGDFDLGEKPSVALPGEETKGDRDARLPLRADTAATVRRWIESEGMGEGDPILEVDPHRTASELRKDLALAGISYRDARGRYADFHALRGSLSTHLNSAGVAPTTAQELLRHKDIRLTLGTYHDQALNEPRKAVEGLPEI